MTSEIAREFVDCVTFEDCVAKLNGSFYFCYGLTKNPANGMFSLRVDKYKALYPETMFLCEVLNVESKDRNDCMGHFQNDAFWEGKNFWEAAPDMEWTDYAGE